VQTGGRSHHVDPPLHRERGRQICRRKTQPRGACSRTKLIIGDAIKPFDGDTAGAKLTELLRYHILISADVIGAALIDKTNERKT
jgi:hypothetical protein